MEEEIESGMAKKFQSIKMFKFIPRLMGVET